MIYDITALIHPDMPCWPGERHVYKHHYASSFDNGDSVNVSRISCSMHLGTHIDAPYHKDNNGKKLNKLPLERFMGDACVVDLTRVDDCITLNDIKDIDFHDCAICLFKTKNSELWGISAFNPDFIYIDKKSARFLADSGIKAVGIDYLSVDSYYAEAPLAHDVFFAADVLVYEGIDLREVNEGRYYFIGLPLRIHDAEGSPVRALLIDKKEKGI